MKKIPNDILCSTILSENDLKQLEAIEIFPTETTVNEYKLLELSDLFLTFGNDAAALEKKLHERAKELLQSARVTEAWMVLLAFNNG